MMNNKSLAEELSCFKQRIVELINDNNSLRGMVESLKKENHFLSERVSIFEK
jgi:hypothetical protein